jgi:hypothetical protein
VPSNPYKVGISTLLKPVWGRFYDGKTIRDPLHESLASLNLFKS